VTESQARIRRSVHPDLLDKLDRPGGLLDYMESIGKPMKIAQGARTAEYQNQLFRQGRDEKGRVVGRVVTWADGYINRSNHQLARDGYGRAVDLCFIDDPRTPKDESWDEALWQEYGPKMWAKARELGLRCGADWPGTKQDRPHIELPPLMPPGTLNA
jgi:peptidoglycan L-alanyl-D-glutamate endopeptidase CwlK